MNEFIEVAVPTELLEAAGDNEQDLLDAYRVLLYNGFYGYIYKTDAIHPLSTFNRTSVSRSGSSSNNANGVTFFYKTFPPAACTKESEWCGLQNGKDGMALAQFFDETAGRIIEFLSYEGVFTAKDGFAAGVTTTDVAIEERSTTPQGWSIAKQGTGCSSSDFTWCQSDLATNGTTNSEQTITCQVAFVNEFHYADDNDGEGEQFIEVAIRNKDEETDLSRYSITLYNADDGLPYDAIPLTIFIEGDTTEEGLTFYYYEFPLQTDITVIVDSAAGVDEANTTSVVTSPDIALLVTKTVLSKQGNVTSSGGAGIVLTRDDVVVDFVSYGGSFEAMAGVAQGFTSVDTGVVESKETTPPGSSLQLVGTGCDSPNFVWTLVESNLLSDEFTGTDNVGATPGQANVQQSIVCLNTPNQPTVAPVNQQQEEDDDDDFLDKETTVDYSTTSVRIAEYDRGIYKKPLPGNE